MGMLMKQIMPDENNSNSQADRIRLSLEDTIKETNRVAARWVSDINRLPAGKRGKLMITVDDVKSVFNGFFKKMLKHHICDDIEATRFMSWNKPHIRLNEDTLQIISVEFLQMRDSDHKFKPMISKALSEIVLPTLHYKIEDEAKAEIQRPYEVTNITFDSITNIKF